MFFVNIYLDKYCDSGFLRSKFIYIYSERALLKMLDILGNEILKLLLPKDGFVTIDYPIHVYSMVFEGNYTTRAKNVIDE